MAYLCLTCLILLVGHLNAESLLDEEDTQSDTSIPNRMVTEDDDTTTLRWITCASSIVDWAEENVGDTHIGKRKIKIGPRKDKGKKANMMDGPVL
jgi:hypothetical protein